MGLGELPDMHKIDDPDGTLTAVGAGMALSAARYRHRSCSSFPVYPTIPKGNFLEREK